MMLTRSGASRRVETRPGTDHRPLGPPARPARLPSVPGRPRIQAHRIAYGCASVSAGQTGYFTAGCDDIRRYADREGPMLKHGDPLETTRCCVRESVSFLRSGHEPDTIRRDEPPTGMGSRIVRAATTSRWLRSSPEQEAPGLEGPRWHDLRRPSVNVGPPPGVQEPSRDRQKAVDPRFLILTTVVRSSWLGADKEAREKTR